MIADFFLSLEVLVLITTIYFSFKEIWVLLYYMYYWKWIQASVFHSIIHIVILLFIPPLTYKYLFNDNKFCILSVLFVYIVLFHLIDERKDYFDIKK